MRLLAMPEGQWNIVQSRDGWHVVRLDSRSPGALASFEDVRDEAAKIWHTEETRKAGMGSGRPPQDLLSDTVRAVTAMRYLRPVLLILIAFMASSALHAHEATLGVLEFREVRPGAYVGRWTMEPSIGAERVGLRVPPHCFPSPARDELRREGDWSGQSPLPISVPTCRRC